MDEEPLCAWLTSAIDDDQKLALRRLAFTCGLVYFIPSRPERSWYGISGMTDEVENPDGVEALLATPNLADALESKPFRRFLDQVPIAIVVSEMKEDEQIVYSNPEFGKVTGLTSAEVAGRPWTMLPGRSESGGEGELGAGIVSSRDFVGTFRIEH
jgi:PAS domain-containing protein